ncbi:MAG: hypothetical protein IJT66_01650 [Clostridia bacterium]|nr:hypothetical protein [Clostridia bacterium]
MFQKMKNKVRSAAVAVKAMAESKKAENYVDSGVKILIAVVIGALLLSLLYALFNTTIMPTVTSKVTELFNYSGT